MDMRDVLPLIMGKDKKDISSIASTLLKKTENGKNMEDVLKNGNPTQALAMQMLTEKPTAKAMGFTPILEIADFEILGRLYCFFNDTTSR